MKFNELHKRLLEWTRIDFQQQYKRPQFIADLQTFHGLDTATLRYRNLTSTSVEVKVEEEQSEDSETEHATEAVGYAVFGEPTILTDTISSSQPDSDYWHQVDLGVQSPRVIIAKPLSYNGGHPAHVRLRNVTDGGFEYKLEEWQYLDGWHGDEIFHMMAVEPSEQELLLDDGSSCRIKSGNTTITDEFSKVSREFFRRRKTSCSSAGSNFQRVSPNCYTSCQCLKRFIYRKDARGKI
ncbi:hypothetical protein ACFFQF_29300 [Haladaptatus pallidirubidus]|uniref:hypothetical protein n=1 Tax=Haladaptatus pallidirubidus TaxID=1008152 RepID=UPI0035EBD853